jgi:hypothetical protein
MESTGAPNRIHVSGEVVRCLEAAGKSHWVTPCERPILVKGKGSMQTYFLNFHMDNATNTSDVAIIDNREALVGQETNDTSRHEIERRISSIEFQLCAREGAEKIDRLVKWNTELLSNVLKEIVASRLSIGTVAVSAEYLVILERERNTANAGNAIGEVQEIIKLPDYWGGNQVDPRSVELDTKVSEQLQKFVANIAKLYQDNPFHNFEHASHVTMSVVSTTCNRCECK